MSVSPVVAAEMFCTIMSMLTPAVAIARKIFAACPTTSGTPRTVTFASLRSCATPDMIACSILGPSRSEERRVGKECRSLCDWSSDVCSSDLRRLPDHVRHAQDGDLRLAPVVCDAGYDRLLHSWPFHLTRLIADPGPRPVAERGPDMNRDGGPPGVLHAAQLQDLRAGRRHLEHFLISDRRDPPGGRHDP